MKLMRVAVGDVKPNPYQPREKFDEEKLQELADNIKAHGLIEPIVVTPKDNKFVIVAGERRWRATKKAGLEEIYALVKEYANEADIKRDSLVENELRENLTNKEFKEFAESLARSLGEPYYNKETGTNPYELSAYILGMRKESTIPLDKGMKKNLHSGDNQKIKGNGLYVKLSRLCKIEKHGAKELKESLESSKISLSLASEIASVDDKDVQRELVKLAEKEEFDKLSEAIKRHNIRQDYEEALSDKKESDLTNKKQMSKPQVLVKLLKRINEWTMDIGGINELLREDNRFMFKFNHEEQLQILDSMKPLHKEIEKFLELMSKSMERISDGKA